MEQLDPKSVIAFHKIRLQLIRSKITNLLNKHQYKYKIKWEIDNAIFDYYISHRNALIFIGPEKEEIKKAAESRSSKLLIIPTDKDLNKEQIEELVLDLILGD